MVTINDVLNKLYKKADRNSCLYCSNLRIHRGEVWCKYGLIDRFYILDASALKKMVNELTKENVCELNDSFLENY